AGDCVAVHDFVKEGLPEWPEMVGSGFDSGIFMSARLSLLSREFATRHGSALVPLVDLCNHSATPAAHQSWDLQGDAMVITAVRDLEAGEELLITYGLTSNPMLLRTYGFVLPPGIEPAWTVSFPVSELIDICGPGPRKELEDRFLPLLEFQLTTAGVVDFLSDAMAACARGGGDGALLLRQLVTSKMEEYEPCPKHSKEEAFSVPTRTATAPKKEQTARQVSWEEVPIGSGKVGVPHGFYAALLECMDECGVSHAAIMGCPLKKNWSEFETRRARTWCGFRPRIGIRPTDRSANFGNEIQWRGLGKLILRFSEVTNLTVGSVPYPGHPALNGIMHEAQRRNLPVMIQHNACSESTKPYKYGFEYTGELEEMLQAYDDVNVLWVDAGIYVRGQWAGYKEELARLMKGNKNLYISITPTVLKLQKIASKDLLEIAEMYPDHVMLGSSTIGTFKDAGSNPAADSGARTGKYKKDWELMKKWAGQLSRETYKKVTFTNAFHLFKHRADNEKFDGGKSFENKITYTSAHQVRTVSSKLHNMENAKQKDYEPPAEKNRMLSGMTDGKLMHDGEIKHVVIDTHLHMLDFLHKSSGTRKILQAMDGCGVEKAVLIGMPCCKKWSKDEPEQPLYYQDDNGQCYFYSYSDQMVADAWMALPDDKRCRFAPVMAGFNPTDINAIAHVERMWDKYPGLWRGLGEVMCRHDDLTMLLQDDECPVINHMAMRPLYEFCIKHDLNCLVHHNADRTAEEESDDHYEYLWEVEQVLTTFPDLKLVWLGFVVVVGQGVLFSCFRLFETSPF
ncbi:unnamed protein product, partial [Polarella glacialis]